MFVYNVFNVLRSLFQIEQLRFRLIEQKMKNTSAEIEFNIEMNLRLDRIAKVPKAMGSIKLHLRTVGSVSIYLINVIIII